jgi:hypothetical protein
MFISHAKADEQIAQKILAGMEGIGISCWIAPRNIRFS